MHSIVGSRQPFGGQRRGERKSENKGSSEKREKVKRSEIKQCDWIETLKDIINTSFSEGTRLSGDITPSGSDFRGACLLRNNGFKWNSLVCFLTFKFAHAVCTFLKSHIFEQCRTYWWSVFIHPKSLEAEFYLSIGTCKCRHRPKQRRGLG